MVLLYSSSSTSRLQYICNFIFKELLNTDVAITTDTIEFENNTGVKINYSNREFSSSSFTLIPAALLFETDIKEQPIECFETNSYKAFFKTIGNFSFDIFAASFYLLSRYEEYLPHEKDMYGRYSHESSLAYKEEFLKLPLINIWVQDFAKNLRSKFSLFSFQFSPFTFIPTYDIDIAYAYKGKGLLKNIGGSVRSFFTFKFSAFSERIAVLAGIKKDPYDTFEWLDKLHKKYNLSPLYFFLVAEKNYLYDKNTLPHTKIMKQLIADHAKKYPIGIHPSWQSGDDLSLLKKEISFLQEVSGKEIKECRRHYLRFNIPEGYYKLLDINMLSDHSMAYATVNGFRASIANSFYWYDLKNEKQTALRVHPFCYMEANSLFEQKVSAEEAFTEMVYYANICKQVGGTMVTLWHNHMISSEKTYKGWAEAYEKFLATL
ncbi:polysaccharide deacetylase family protein [Ferruginibacter albus]|uniref:polysaccharide deacetylase family protein n=1 Tax=Ferruginibacter albus TaxID=2875540 RepID=UPI001CC3B460|nr:polysaccharide deacetylase family protein [Ferruginibacter albus]UAY51867.1 polysaccharide deacetylase family protein [Ferruginibacter albus]